MQKIIPNIRPNEDDYLLDYVDCFEKPIAILLESYGKNQSAFYYIFNSLLKCYNYIADCRSDHFKNMSFIDYINSRFNITIEPCNKEGSINDIIKEQINQDNPILIIGNLRELYYSKHFKTSDWKHLLIVKGYDDEKELYKIMDATQKSSDVHRYEEYVIEYPVLDKMYQSYYHLENTCGIYFAKYTQKQVNLLELLIECIDNLLDCYNSKQPYKELDYINNIMKIISEGECINPEQTCVLIANSYKYKDVLYSELSKMVSVLTGDKTLVNKITDKKTLLIGKWKSIIIICKKACFRNKPISLSKEISDVIQCEVDMKNILLEVREALKVFSESEQCLESDTNDEWLLENNRDSIITLNKTDCMFDFNNNKIYNAWFGDDAPTAFIKAFTEPGKDFILRTSMKVDSCGQFVNFHAGIVFRTMDNEIYFWGSHCGMSLVLERIGTDSKLKRIAISNERVSLQLRKKDNTYYFEYSFDEGTDMIEAYIIDNIKDICQIGFGCKTWNEFHSLRVEFEKELFEFI